MAFKTKISSKLVSLIFAILVVCFAVGFYIFGWTEPSSLPPDDNIDLPLNVSATGQAKAGGLILNTGGADTGLVIEHGNVGIGNTTPSYLLDILMSATDETGIYLDGVTNDFTGTGTGAVYVNKYWRDLNVGDGNDPPDMYLNSFRIAPAHTKATISETKLIVGNEVRLTSSGCAWENTSAGNRIVYQYVNDSRIVDTATYTSTGAGRIQSNAYGLKLLLNLDQHYAASGGATNKDIAIGALYTVNNAPVIDDASNLTVTSDGIRVSVTGTATGSSTNKGINIVSCTGADVNWGIYDDSGAGWVLDGDSQKIFWGEGQDASIYYNGLNLIINPKEIGTGILDILGTVQADGYNSSDGTPGMTGTINVRKADDSGPCTITVKNGLITSTDCP